MDDIEEDGYDCLGDYDGGDLDWGVEMFYGKVVWDFCGYIEFVEC